MNTGLKITADHDHMIGRKKRLIGRTWPLPIIVIGRNSNFFQSPNTYDRFLFKFDRLKSHCADQSDRQHPFPYI